MNTRYIFKKGELNSLNNLNQDLKTIFSSYMLITTEVMFPVAYCIGENIASRGKHLCHTEYSFPGIEIGFVVQIISDKLFQCIKNNKKNIIGYEIIDSDIFLISETEKWEFGIVHKLDSKACKEAIPKLESILETISTEPSTIKLTDDDVLDLTKNEMLNISKDKYRTRITREIIPGLKKTHTVTIRFSNIDNSLFLLSIDVERSTCVSHHVYTCVYI